MKKVDIILLILCFLVFGMGSAFGGAVWSMSRCPETRSLTPVEKITEAREKAELSRCEMDRTDLEKDLQECEEYSYSRYEAVVDCPDLDVETLEKMRICENTLPLLLEQVRLLRERLK